MELSWWKEFVDKWNGKEFIQTEVLLSSDLGLYTDVSKLGMGGVYKTHLFSCPWPAHKEKYFNVLVATKIPRKDGTTANRDPPTDLGNLQGLRKTFLQAGIAESTLKSNKIGWNKYSKFCAQINVPLLPLRQNMLKMFEQVRLYGIYQEFNLIVV